jgi:hypothetical protein
MKKRARHDPTAMPTIPPVDRVLWRFDFAEVFTEATVAVTMVASFVEVLGLSVFVLVALVVLWLDVVVALVMVILK